MVATGKVAVAVIDTAMIGGIDAIPFLELKLRLLFIGLRRLFCNSMSLEEIWGPDYIVTASLFIAQF